MSNVTLPTSGAWLQLPEGHILALEGNSSLGRSSDNQIVVASERASRRHAIIHAQEGGEYWLADLGSSNGTFLNERRLAHPTRLKDGDQIRIGPVVYGFHQTIAQDAEDEMSQISQRTVVDVRTEPCWLLIADLVNFTPLSQKLPADDLAALVGRWVRTCKEQVEGNGGVINKFLGDGFMAFWRRGDEATEAVAKAAAGLRAAQATSEIEFRVILHFGKVALGGAASLGEESLMGPEVNFAFRMEKVAGEQAVPFCLSEGAQRLLAARLPMSPVPGEHGLKGFPAKYRFFAFGG